ncbi:MAG: tetratricopeptide repeat protein [Ignavibacteriae bacterium]|nr:tetratricopeptide repeat protein [Ignavibacteriota bacterium]
MRLKRLLLLSAFIFLSNVLFSQSYQDDYLKGYKLLEKANYEESIKYFTKSINSKPSFYYSYVRRGIANYYLNNTDAALKDIEEGIKAIDDMPGGALYDPNYGSSSVDFDIYYKSSTIPIEAFYYKGLILETGNFSEALKCFIKANDFVDEEADKKLSYLIYYHIGMCHFNLGDLENSITFLVRSTIVNEYAPSYFQIGLCYLRLNDNSEACKYFRKAKILGSNEAAQYISSNCGSNSKDQGIADSYFNQGIENYNRDYYREAITFFKKAIKYNPDMNEAYFYEGYCYEKLNEYNDAVNCYTIAITYCDSAKYYFRRGISYHYLKQTELKIKDYKKVVEINPNHYLAFDNLGWSYLENYYSWILSTKRGLEKDINNSVQYFLKALELRPNDLDVLIGLSSAFYIYDKENKCKEYLKKAFSVEPKLKSGFNKVNVLENMGYFYSETEKRLISEMFDKMKK